MSNRLLELKQAKAAALDQASAILGKLKTENRNVMTTEEKTAHAGFLAEATGIDETMTAEMVTAAAGNIPTDQQNRGGSPRAQVYENAVDKPWGYNLLGERAEAHAGETKDQRRFRVEVGFGEYMMAVKNAERRNAHIDVRLLSLNEGYEKRAQAAGASEMVPSDGGWLVYPDFAQEIMMLAHDAAAVYPRMRKLPLSEYTNAIKIPAIDEQSRKDGYRWGGVQAFWENEAAALVGSKPTFAMLELVTKKLTGLFYATNEVLADARLLGSIVLQAFGEEFAFKLDDGGIRGTGAGQMLGILSPQCHCLVSVAKETGQAAGTFLYENARNMWSRMWARSRNNSAWFINQDVEGQLYGMTLAVGTGGVPVYLPPGANGGIYGGATAPPYGTLFGRPVYAIEQCSTVGTQGDVILADFGQYLTVDKGDMQTAVSAHVRFLDDQQTFRWILRVDGMPQWKTSLTPAQGTNKLSPFVVTDTRA